MSQSFNMMQAVKRRFFAMRNGALAEQMKSAGALYRINFGLLQAQIADIARQVIEGTLDERPEKLTPEIMADLARSLRDNASTRESQLIAPMIFPVELLSKDEALDWLISSPSTEVSDTLCHKLMRAHPSGLEISEEVLANSDAGELQRYGALRLLLNLLVTHSVNPERAKHIAEKFLANDSKMVAQLAAQLVERCSI